MWEPSDRIALAGVTVTPIVSLWLFLAGQKSRRREIEAQQRREADNRREERLRQAGEIIGPVFALLNDASAAPAGPEWRKASGVQELFSKWREIRPDLARFAAGLWSPEGGEIAARLLVVIDNVAMSTERFLAGQEDLEVLNDHIRQAIELGQELMEVLRRDGG
jgi:hypothetical protein